MHVTRRQSEIQPEGKISRRGQFFLDIRTFHLGLKAENFHPGVKWTS